MAEADLKQALAKSFLLIEEIYSRLEGKDLPATDRNRIAGGCLHAALAHRMAIAVLIQNGLHGSASALMRVLFEAYLRGAWLRTTSDEHCIQKFREDKVPGVSILIAEIETNEAFDSGNLSRLKKKYMRFMNDLVHTGMQQVVRHNSARELSISYEDDELVEMLAFSDWIGFSCAVEFSFLLQDLELAASFLDLIRNEK